jgi:hypothetical protein
MEPIDLVDTSHLEKEATDGSNIRNILHCNGVRHESCTTMNVDDVLFGLIVCGIGLVGAWFRSEYVLLRELRATQRRKEGIMRKLHLERPSSQADDGDQLARTG